MTQTTKVFKAKIDSFLTFYVKQHFSADILFVFLPMKIRKQNIRFRILQPDCSELVICKWLFDLNPYSRIELVEEREYQKVKGLDETHPCPNTCQSVCIRIYLLQHRWFELGLKTSKNCYFLTHPTPHFNGVRIGFHLYLLVFPSVYQFNSRIEVLVK